MRGGDREPKSGEILRAPTPRSGVGFVVGGGRFPTQRRRGGLLCYWLIIYLAVLLDATFFF